MIRAFLAVIGGVVLLAILFTACGDDWFGDDEPEQVEPAPEQEVPALVRDIRTFCGRNNLSEAAEDLCVEVEDVDNVDDLGSRRVTRLVETMCTQADLSSREERVCEDIADELDLDFEEDRAEDRATPVRGTPVPGQATPTTPQTPATQPGTTATRPAAAPPVVAGAGGPAAAMINVPGGARVDAPSGSRFGPLQVTGAQPLTIWQASITQANGQPWPTDSNGAAETFGGSPGNWMVSGNSYIYAPSGGATTSVVTPTTANPTTVQATPQQPATAPAAAADKVEQCPPITPEAFAAKFGGKASDWHTIAAPNGLQYRGTGENPVIAFEVPADWVVDWSTNQRAVAGQQVRSAVLTPYCLPLDP